MLSFHFCIQIFSKQFSSPRQSLPQCTFCEPDENVKNFVKHWMIKASNWMVVELLSDKMTMQHYEVFCPPVIISSSNSKVNHVMEKVSQT